mmetsp:Transcript_2073/g.3069  ORF Transcript_2073/g.3069 Transcript_2073/m.3069 type:complete len:243 (-) Transcript_2073:1254-1982(-)
MKRNESASPTLLSSILETGPDLEESRFSYFRSPSSLSDLLCTPPPSSPFCFLRLSFANAALARKAPTSWRINGALTQLYFIETSCTQTRRLLVPSAISTNMPFDPSKIMTVPSSHDGQSRSERFSSLTYTEAPIFGRRSSRISSISIRHKSLNSLASAIKARAPTSESRFPISFIVLMLILPLPASLLPLPFTPISDSHNKLMPSSPKSHQLISSDSTGQQRRMETMCFEALGPRLFRDRSR